MTPLYRAALLGLEPFGCSSPALDAATVAVGRAAVFDVSAAWDAICYLGDEFHRERGGLGDYGFLPAESCLFERRDPTTPLYSGDARSGCLAEVGRTGRVFVWHLRWSPGRRVRCMDAGEVDLVNGEHTVQAGCIPFFLATLAIVNAPRGVERESVPPHKGHSRALRAQGVSANLLRSWTRVKLREPARQEGMGAVGGGAPKAYHFCRQHMRQRLGNTEIVRAHWRGNPALGIVRKTYAVEGPPNPSQPSRT